MDKMRANIIVVTVIATCVVCVGYVFFAGNQTKENGGGKNEEIVKKEREAIAIRDEIENVLVLHVLYSEALDSKEGEQLIRGFAFLAQNLRSIDTSKCPADFQRVFLRHIQSVDEFVKEVQPLQSGGDAFVAGLAKGASILKRIVTLDFDGAGAEGRDFLDVASGKKIEACFENMEATRKVCFSIAEKYGVDLD